MKKIEKDYLDKYGNIPEDYNGRMDYLLSTLKCGRLKENLYQSIDYISSIKWKKLSYVIYIIPKGTPRPRAGKFGVFYVKGSKDNKKLFKQFMDAQKDINYYCGKAKLFILFTNSIWNELVRKSSSGNGTY